MRNSFGMICDHNTMTLYTDERQLPGLRYCSDSISRMNGVLKNCKNLPQDPESTEFNQIYNHG
jgi:hypothetical protein